MNVQLLAERIIDKIEENGWEIVEFNGHEACDVHRSIVLIALTALLENEQANVNSIPPSSFA